MNTIFHSLCDQLNCGFYLNNFYHSSMIDYKTKFATISAKGITSRFLKGEASNINYIIFLTPVRAAQSIEVQICQWVPEQINPSTWLLHAFTNYHLCITHMLYNYILTISAGNWSQHNTSKIVINCLIGSCTLLQVFNFNTKVL